MIYHFVVGDMAAQPLQEAILSEPSIQGEVIVLKDILHVGPLQKEEGQGFSALRGAFWQQVTNSAEPVEVTDMERLLEVSKHLYDNPDAVSYTHLDVYKRQAPPIPGSNPPTAINTLPQNLVLSITVL